MHGSLLAVGLEGLVDRGVQVLTVVHGRQVQVLRVRPPQCLGLFLGFHVALVGLQEGRAAELVLGHRGLPLGDACIAAPGRVATTSVRGNEVRAVTEALGQAQGAAEEQDARRLHLGSEHAQVNTSWLLVRPADCGAQLEERLRQDLKLQATDEGHDGLHAQAEGHGDALLDGRWLSVESVALPFVPVVFHPTIVTGHGPRFQLKEIVLVADLPVGFAHTVTLPVLRSKSQARAGVGLPAVELGDELRGMDVVTAAHLVGDDTIGIVTGL